MLKTATVEILEEVIQVLKSPIIAVRTILQVVFLQVVFVACGLVPWNGLRIRIYKPVPAYKRVIGTTIPNQGRWWQRRVDMRDQPYQGPIQFRLQDAQVIPAWTQHDILRVLGERAVQ